MRRSSARVCALSAMALAGRVGVILGVANKHSLAWTVAQAWHAAGALVTISCQNERFDKRLEQMVSELAPSPTVSQPACHALCDVANESEVTKLFTSVADRCGRVDMVFHAIANAPTPALKGSFLDTTMRSQCCQSRSWGLFSFEDNHMKRIGRKALQNTHYTPCKWEL